MIKRNTVSKGCKRVPVIMVLCLWGVFSGLLFGQGGKGKIAGKVIDAQTREMLTGVNIRIDGTKQGATSDRDGLFTILNVNPGHYSVTASMIGYGTITQADVEVYIDRTTRLDFELKDASIQIQAITIKAQKPKIIKDQTSSTSTLDAEQLKTAPIEGLRGALDLNASLQKNAQGDFQVRGSGTNEVSFLVNGVDQGNSNTSVPGWGGGTKADNSWKYDVNPLGVAQMQLITGGFSAEYGNAQAGVVKVLLKEGTPRFTGDVRVEYRPAGQYHWGNYIYDKNSFEWQTWGKREYWDKKAQEAYKTRSETNIFTELGLNKREKTLYDKYIKGTASAEEKVLWDSIAKSNLDWAYRNWVALHSPSDENPLGVYDYRTHDYNRISFGLGGPVGKDPDLLKFFLSGEYLKKPTRIPSTERDQIRQNYTMTLVSNAVKDNKFKFTGSFLKYVGGLFSGSDDIRWAGISAFDKYQVQRDPVRTELTTAQSLNWVWTLDRNSFLETTLSHQYEKYELPYRYLLTWNDENDRLDSARDYKGVLLLKGSWWDQTYFDSYENIATDFFQDNRSDQFSFKSDYTNQVNQMNLIKTGLQLNYWDLVNSGVTYNFKANAFVTQQGVAEHYIAYPINAAFYLQDKMEYEGMIANLGIRVEGYNFQTDMPVDPFNVFYPGTQGPGTLGSLKTERSKTKYVVLPRVGLSFPIGEATAFRMQYGHFASMPIFSQALGNSIFYGWNARGNPDLEPKKTINYEFGLQQMLDDENKLDIAVYYVDRVTQIGTQSIAAYTGNIRNNAGFTSSNLPLYTYNSFQNNMFGSTIGIDITLEKTNFRDFGYRLSYTLSQTTDGVYGSSVLYPENASFYESRITSMEHVSSYDRTHTFRGLFQYTLTDEEGYDILGVKAFSGSIIAVTYSVQSGLPFTYRAISDLKDVVNNRRYPLESNIDINFSTTFEAYGKRILFGVRVMNAFNNRWLTPFASTENDDMLRWLNNGVTMDQPDDPTKKSFLLNPYRAYRNAPRQIFFTLGVGF